MSREDKVGVMVAPTLASSYTQRGILWKGYLLSAGAAPDNSPDQL
jgi:hypothetical protein